MIVVSDTSPINYLILINCETLLKALFRKVAVPTAVLTELQSEGAPQKIRNWLTHMPDWIEVRQGDMPESHLPDLGLGEREAIYLAQSIGADAMLMDDAKGRLAAERWKRPIVAGG
jgi:predicted nucleic acid-binding protein